ncbi:APC family permease [Caldivirga maquilingensis]|uniref:Amino acid permease-associated region n=1 Tax=Caldivirga maquilingensis (strain ATCC 700844 / DSM 13496 / JCM 10307 / IC-167) TaxID=397948 RepID=A8MDE0_CALMQ|nr:APC family permease [Caldivirga maquilingensis]ABW01796.1 amino acid permease-associated region [Caldivirga maquilingensis IC-167]
MVTTGSSSNADKQYSSSNGLRRVLGFKELFFASLGGQSPFLSITTYGTAIILYAGLLAPLAALVGTLIVLVNGLVVYQLSRRLTKTGGYYAYANQFISHRVGIETGFIYLFYSILYGSAYAIGSAGIMWFLFHINFMYTLTAILIIQAVLAILGIKPSAKYAVFAGSLELGILIVIGVVLLYLSGFRISLSLTASQGISLTQFGYAALFAAAIPTGYGTITPLSGETRMASKTVPKAIVAVILTGGLLAMFDLLAFNSAGLALFESYGRFESLIKSMIGMSTFNSPILYLLHKYFGIFIDIPVLVALINDGVLGVLAYNLASSRVLFAMSMDGWAPKPLSYINVNTNNPMLAALVSSIGIIAVSLATVDLLSPLMAFLVLGGLSTMAGLLVHVISDVSLMRLSIRRIKKYTSQIILASSALILAAYSITSALVSTRPMFVELFLGWLIIGFIYAEASSIAKGR